MNEYRVHLARQRNAQSETYRLVADSLAEAVAKAEATLTTGSREDGWEVVGVTAVSGGWSLREVAF